MTVTPMVDNCWPIDITACEEAWDDLAPEVQQQAEQMAGATMRMLTGYRVGGCPINLRPCRKDCGPMPTWVEFPVFGSGNWAGAYGGPAVIQGRWYNITCGCGIDNCSCTTVCEVILPGAPTVIEVSQDGVLLDPTAWRVDNGNRLIRLDGLCWPLCQDMTDDGTGPGTFVVRYTPGLPVDEWGAAAAGALACEYAKALGGSGECHLPPNVTQVTRLGVSLTLGPEEFPNGMTGIRSIDTYISAVNPHHLASPSLIVSPDVSYGRQLR